MSVDKCYNLSFGVSKDVKGMGPVVLTRFNLKVSYISTLEDLILRLNKMGYNLNPWFGTGHDFRSRTHLPISDPSLIGFLESPRQGYIHLTELPVSIVLDASAIQTIKELNRERDQFASDLANYQLEIDEKIKAIRAEYEVAIQMATDELQRVQKERLAAIKQVFGTEYPKVEGDNLDAWIQKTSNM